MVLDHLLLSLGEEIADAYEGRSLAIRSRVIDESSPESFLLFSQASPTRNLGFIDSKASCLEVSVNGRSLTIQQSPSVLSSNRAGGTTGAGKSTMNLRRPISN